MNSSPAENLASRVLRTFRSAAVAAPLLGGHALAQIPAPSTPVAPADGKFRSSEEFSNYAQKLREKALSVVEPRATVSTVARSTPIAADQWKQDIVTTVFWIGTKKEGGNATSAWDPKWREHFGGSDLPAAAERSAEGQEFRASGFVPRLNPFYFALPYNDVANGKTKPEAKVCIPWFSRLFMQEGQSVLRDHWLAIRNRQNGRIAYAQWAECGPFGFDQWQYVFGKERPRPNISGGAGLEVSPAVRDYLALQATDVTDWRFVEAREVPVGPWRRYGENNPFVQQARQQAKATPAPANAARDVVPRIMVR